jgi:SAM-dependent methyltransferase
MPASHLATNARVLSFLEEAGKIGGDILDLGAGEGYFTRALSAERARRGIKPGAGLEASDIERGSFSAEGVRFTRADANQGLPYPDASFDAVVAIEVMEHTRAPYAVLGEIARVLKPGGIVVFSVPNVGHLGSRLHFLASGHYQMFPSPSTAPKNGGRLCGHVAPLPFQYWHYGLRLAGFSSIALHGDRLKKNAAALAVLLWPWLQLTTAAHLRRLSRHDPPLYAETADVARAANGWTALTSRSLVLSAVKPDLSRGGRKPRGGARRARRATRR